MSANAALLPCPVCSHAVFESTETLRDRLIFVSTNNILCPICQEEVTGIDKLTIHLFSHVKLISTHISASKEMKDNNKSICKSPPQNKKSKLTGTKNKGTVSNTPVKYVRICPKLPVVSVNAMPVLDISRSTVDDQINGANTLSIAAVKTEVLTAQPSDTVCNICELQFINANILKMHRCLIHNLDENANTTFSRHQCQICPKSFKMRGSLMVHLRVAHYGFQNHNKNLTEIKDINECDMSDVNNSKPNIMAIEKNDNKQWQCDVCRKCFTTKYFLKKHKRLHTGETPYACAQCNKTFTFQQSYHKHLLYHNDDKPHVCSFCGRAFKELSTLHNHQRIHTGEKPFSCESCGKCFRQRVSYLVHRRIHTGVMPYKCTACEKSFRYKVSQRTHKCQAQPPGAVVRQTGDLLEKLKKKHLDNSKVAPEICKTDTYDNTEIIISGAQLSFEDTEKDNFMLLDPTFDQTMKIDITENAANHEENEPIKMDVNTNNSKSMFSPTIEDLIQTLPSEENNVPSPSEILRNLCLSSDQDNVPQDNRDVMHDFLKEFEFL